MSATYTLRRMGLLEGLPHTGEHCNACHQHGLIPNLPFYTPPVATTDQMAQQGLQCGSIRLAIMITTLSREAVNSAIQRKEKS